MIHFSAFNDSVETVCLALGVASDVGRGFLREFQSSRFPNSCPLVKFGLTRILYSILNLFSIMLMLRF